MANWKHFYLFRIEFLGFRFHGWQKQPNLRTVEGTIERTFRHVLDHTQFKILGCGRTDALVSAEDFAFELFLFEAVDEAWLLENFNANLPADIRGKSIALVDNQFNIIKTLKTKEYHYRFSFGEASHPFNAPFIRYFREEFDIEAMKKAAKIFEGEHYFKRFVCKPKPNSNFTRTILSAEIIENPDLNGGFFPTTSFLFKVKSNGFMRYQVRMMMGALLEIGRGTLSEQELENALIENDEEPLKFIAPAAGLILHKIDF